ncbi:phosphopantetheine-binding protein [Streptomyces sp. M19]
MVAEVLGVDRVGPDDNFFERGGDSIGSIQLVSRARAAGLMLTPKQVFQLKTVARLAAAATEVAEAVEAVQAADDGLGDVPLTPVVHDLRARGGTWPGSTSRCCCGCPRSWTSRG